MIFAFNVCQVHIGNCISSGLAWRQNIYEEESEIYGVFSPVFSEEDLFQAFWSHNNS